VALAYTEDVSSEALLVALLYGVVLIMRRAGVSHGVPYFLVGSRRVDRHDRFRGPRHNRTRRHSSLGMLSRAAYERLHDDHASAA
jgi:hypothetical protein